jgi:hypothetical protein
VLDAVEAAVQAHARAHGPIALPNGQEYGYALEPTESYETGPAFEVLAERVGDERANRAFVGTADRMKAALREGLGVERLPRGAWDALRGEIEARGGVVPGVREVWRKRWPAKPVEVVHAVEDMGAAVRAEVRAGPVESRVVRSNADVHHLEATELPSGCGGGGRETAPETAAEQRAGLSDRDGSDARGYAAQVGGPGGHSVLTARAPCPVCGASFALNGNGTVRAHSQPGGGLRCSGSRQKPAQLMIGDA